MDKFRNNQLADYLNGLEDTDTRLFPCWKCGGIARHNECEIGWDEVVRCPVCGAAIDGEQEQIEYEEYSFNSKMVRLRVHQNLDHCFFSTVSIPKWCD